MMLVAGSVMLALACLAQTQRKLLVAQPFSAGCVLAAFWCFLAAWQVQTDTLEEKLLIIKLGFTFLAIMPLLGLEVTYRFVHERRLLYGWRLAAALVVPIMTAALAWTINSSPVFRYDCWLDASGPIPLLRFKQGPWNAIFFGYTYALAAWSFAILLSSLRSATPWGRRARLFFLVARIIPLVFDILYHFNLLPPAGMNYAPASLAVSDILIALIFFGDPLGARAYVARSTLAEKIGDPLVVLDSRRRVLDINRAAAEELGVRLEDVQGESVEMLFGSWAEVLAHLHDGTKAFAEVTRNGKWFELSVLPSESAKARTMILWLRNITRRKLAELNHAAAAAAATQANAAKDRYLAVMSHEIRGPLNSALGFMRLLENTPLNSEQKEYVGHALRSGESLLALINEILDFSKIEAGRMRLASAPFDLRAEVTSLCRALEIEAKTKGLAFAFHIAPEVPEVLVGDKQRIGQILRNLVSNAIKFTATGGVTVRAECPGANETACRIRLVVADTGIGIAGDALKTLFQPFAQATSAIQHEYGGTGLGLVIALRFSELMGGSLTAESAPQKGSTFTCELQLRIGQRPAGPSPEPGAEPAEASLRILIVDDQPANRRLLEIMLARMNHRTSSATNGRECLEILQREHFDVVIMDLEMPAMNGFETAAKILENGLCSSPPYIIALSAHASSDIRQQCLAAGMRDYISKPLTPSALEEALRMGAGAAAWKNAGNPYP